MCESIKIRISLKILRIKIDFYKQKLEAVASEFYKKNFEHKIFWIRKKIIFDQKKGNIAFYLMLYERFAFEHYTLLPLIANTTIIYYDWDPSEIIINEDFNTITNISPRLLRFEWDRKEKNRFLLFTLSQKV